MLYMALAVEMLWSQVRKGTKELKALSLDAGEQLIRLVMALRKIAIAPFQLGNLISMLSHAYSSLVISIFHPRTNHHPARFWLLQILKP